jgi:hypothetical protein
VSISVLYEIVIQWLTANAQWLGALCTLALAAVTFVVAILLPFLKKPKFTTKFDNVAPYCIKNDKTPPQSYWLRLKVTNSGKAVARNCSGKLVKIIGDAGEITNYEPVKLHWVGTQWGDMFYFKTIDLNRGEYDFLDILVTRADVQRRAFLFTPDLFGDKPKEIPAEARIQVTIHGDDVKPCSREYSISWVGDKYTDIRLKKEKVSY